MRDLPDATPADVRATGEALKRELSRVARVLAEMATGEPATRASWGRALEALGDMVPAARRVADWSAPDVPPLSVAAYLVAAEKLCGDLELIAGGW